MRYANLIPHAHITRGDCPQLAADARHAFNTERAAVKLALAAPLPPRPPAPLHLRVIRGLSAAGELISAIAIIGAGAWLVGLATTL